MTKNDYRELVDDTFRTINGIIISKGEEYSNSDDQLANFKRGAERTGLTPQQVWSVLYHKHMDAIDHYVRTGRTLSEDLDGRINDAIHYLLLLKALYHDHQSQQRE